MNVFVKLFLILLNNRNAIEEYWSAVAFKSDDSMCLPGIDRVDQGQDQVRGRGQDSEQSHALGIKQSQARGRVLPPEVRPLQRGQDRQAQRKQRQMKRKKILKLKFSNFKRKRSR